MLQGGDRGSFGGPSVQAIWVLICRMGVTLSRNTCAAACSGPLKLAAVGTKLPLPAWWQRGGPWPQNLHLTLRLTSWDSGWCHAGLSSGPCVISWDTQSSWPCTFSTLAASLTLPMTAVPKFCPRSPLHHTAGQSHKGFILSPPPLCPAPWTLGKEGGGGCVGRNYFAQVMQKMNFGLPW